MSQGNTDAIVTKTKAVENHDNVEQTWGKTKAGE